tara:strand:- start:580 stop:1488 length:909 start_codon:yes stop_codon:yes gene_type:complete
MPGDNNYYASLTLDSSFAATSTGSSENIPGVDGYVFDLFQADVSLTLDPSFAAALPGGTGFAAVDAIATFDLSASVFNNLFFITVDSSDIDNVDGNDVVFSIDAGAVVYPFVDSDGSMAFSNSTVQYGAVNNQYADQSMKKDIVRHIAKSITGGYAVADIFSNEAELITDVESRDANLHGTLGSAIDSLKAVTEGYTVDKINSTDISDSDQLRFFQVAQSLFGINVNDTGAGGRQEALFADLSNSSVDNSGNALASVTVPLTFKVGDAIALRIQYDPNSSPVGGMGDNTISSRSYKILIPLT